MPAPTADVPKCDVPGCGRPASASTDGSEKDPAYTLDPVFDPQTKEKIEGATTKRFLSRKALPCLNLCDRHLTFAFTDDAKALVNSQAFAATYQARAASTKKGG